jgi:histidinol-phosphate aminotransferase
MTFLSILNTLVTGTVLPQSHGKSGSELLHPRLHSHSPPLVELASNENPIGPSQRALEVIKKIQGRVARYPDPSGNALRSLIARQHGVASEQIVLGNGSSEILELVARGYLSSGTSAVYSQYAFFVYPMVIKAAGGRGIEVRAQAFGNDPSALLGAIEADTRILFIANPNNPTGTLLETAELLDLIQRIPTHVLIVLDEAYYEYLLVTTAPPSVKWLDQFPNLLITRTFSKAYGLAGLRLGFAIAHPSVSNVLNRIRLPFNVNAVAQLAAMAALGDTAHLTHTILANQVGIRQLTQGLIQYGVDFIPSHGNFIAFRAGDAKLVHQGLLYRGILVRELDNYGMPEYLRVTVGTKEENQKFLLALADLLPLAK